MLSSTPIDHAHNGIVYEPSKNKPFARGLLYVAISRATDLEKVALLLPIRPDHFINRNFIIKEINEEYLILKAPSKIARLCFIAEVIVLIIAFIVMFYISYITKNLETKLTFTLLNNNNYNCIVLSPRRDSTVLYVPCHIQRYR